MLTRRELFRYLSVPLLVGGSGTLTTAQAQGYWHVLGDVRVGGVRFSVGVWPPHRGRHGRYPGYYYRTNHRLRYPSYRCGRHCYRSRGYDYHHQSCSLLGAHLERYGAPPAYYERWGWSGRDGYRPGYRDDDWYDDRYRYPDDRYRRGRGRRYRYDRW